jgi:hypothetical protein
LVGDASSGADLPRPRGQAGSECDVIGAWRSSTLKNICAENNEQLFEYKIPIASKPDF